MGLSYENKERGREAGRATATTIILDHIILTSFIPYYPSLFADF